VKLLFAHGWGFDRHFWEPLAALLPERALRRAA
jgi:pimeloyl-[acyl-carrier protein] methyl ester esterase